VACPWFWKAGGRPKNTAALPLLGEKSASLGAGATPSLGAHQGQHQLATRLGRGG